MVVWLQYVSGCDKSTIKVQRKYMERKAYVQLKYGKRTVKVQFCMETFFGGYCTVWFKPYRLCYGTYFTCYVVLQVTLAANLEGGSRKLT